ncbi:hypothetical protein AB0D27_44320 [Streptomyces sp. NPDC048415]|uniref:hypothetical protein n=1 Tax=Streptomyces sp. NPDC048415 TaxID=3154822 RepID=UPI003428341D
MQQLTEYRFRAVREVLGGSPIGEVAARYGNWYARKSLLDIVDLHVATEPTNMVLHPAVCFDFDPAPPPPRVMQQLI